MQRPPVRALLLRRSVLLLLAFMLTILVAPYFAPYDLHSGLVSQTKYQPPSSTHVMGTNTLDVDLFSLVLKGSQVSLIIAASATAISLAIGLAYGMISAMVGGWFETVLMRITDISFSLPRFLILLAVSSIVSEPLSVPQLILLIGMTGWFEVARLTRGEVGSLLTRDWVLAAQATGVSRARLAARHIFPHLVPILAVMATLGIGHVIVLEAGLMFLGAGGPQSSLGSLLQSASGISGWDHWWLVFFPGIAIVLIVLACNALGDALRDVFAPEQVHAWPTT
ncbi:MAG: ABC transporter permease [Gemmatimonas sp.]